MRILFDTNVLLDALLARDPFVADASSLLQAIESGTQTIANFSSPRQYFTITMPKRPRIF